MTLAWRIGIDTPGYTADDLSGAGAEQIGGRWNRKGTSVVYASSSQALACLDTIVHFHAQDLPLNRYLVRVDIPDRVMARAVRFDAAAHVGWDAIPEGWVSIDAGEAWVKSGASAVMVVPSVIVPDEANILINPAHADARRVTATKVREWLYDGRLGRSARTYR